MTTANKAIQEAKKWLGTSQGGSRHRGMIDAYNAVLPRPAGYKMKYTDHWCSTFITFVFDRLNASDLIGRECGVERHIQLFKQRGIWREDGTITPKLGDIITYNWDKNAQPNDGWADHIGIVEKIANGQITVIEGNISGKVARRTIRVGHGQIRGFAQPKYMDRVEPDSGGGSYKKPIADIAQEVINGDWGTGHHREIKLKAAGYDYDEVQAEVNRIYGVKAPAKKSIDQIAQEVIDGKWGNGSDRRTRIEKAGYNYTTVQNKVNALLGISGGSTKRTGKWRFDTPVKIRSGPSTSHAQVGLYKAGDTVNLDGVETGHGYIWGTYIAYSGARRYVALQPVNGTPYGKWI